MRNSENIDDIVLEAVRKLMLIGGFKLLKINFTRICK